MRGPFCSASASTWMAASVLSCGMLSTARHVVAGPRRDDAERHLRSGDEVRAEVDDAVSADDDQRVGLGLHGGPRRLEQLEPVGSVSDCTSWPSARRVWTSAGPISDFAPNDADGLMATTTRLGFSACSRMLGVTVGPFVAPAVDPEWWFSARTDPAQQLRVERHHDGRDRHRGRTDGGGIRNPAPASTPAATGGTDRVVAGRPDQVLQHLAVARAGQRDRVGDAARVARRQHDARGLDRDVGPGADGDAQVGTCERRRVVDAVADHRDALRALLLQPRHHIRLLPRKHLGEHLVDSELLATWSATSCESPVSIATRTPDFWSAATASADSGRTTSASANMASARSLVDTGRRPSPRPRPPARRVHQRWVEPDAALGHQPRARDGERPARRPSRTHRVRRAPRTRRRAGRLRRTLLGRDDGPRDRVLGARLDGRREREHVILVSARRPRRRGRQPGAPR